MADFDVVVAGAGLAGACAAFVLSRDRRVLVIDADEPASGASGIAAGMANPLMSKRARPVWRMEEALHSFENVVEEAAAGHLVRRQGLLRRAEGEEQAAVFRVVADELPNHATWLSAEACLERFPDVRAPSGALWGPTAVSVSISALIHALLRSAGDRGAALWPRTTLHAWSSASHGAHARVAVSLRRGSGPTIESLSVHTPRLLLALGRDYADFGALQGLRLHQVKGQLVRVRRPDVLRSLPNVAGRGYVMAEGDALLLGSTYQHAFCDLRPELAQTRNIMRDAADLVPALANAEVIEERAGVRVTVPGVRLPMVGPLPGAADVYLFTGLGSKGLLMAPLVACELPAYLENPDAIPREIRVRNASSSRN